MIGKIIYSEDFSSKAPTTNIDISTFAKGVYILELSSEGQKINRKIIKY